MSVPLLINDRSTITEIRTPFILFFVKNVCTVMKQCHPINTHENVHYLYTVTNANNVTFILYTKKQIMCAHAHTPHTL